MKTLVSIELLENNGQLSINYQNGDPNQPLETETIEKLIAALTSMREAMQPPVPQDPPLGKEVYAQFDPRFWVELNHMASASTLLLRHPGLGWLAFVLPPNSAVQLTGYLQQQAEELQRGPGPAN
ncbi:hypothetical protein [Burkholderia arboris]|uniref:hypothetical protein n=1 Tax=Burkholderia arboris TaxID=488730 RepID=UPI00210A99AF|nr:hypothetical protein [Burkholderia arboris]UTV56407.1 hypothetical protein NLX30_08535 [Burkholderia arboris]UTV56466.1 hypothetical protein NLX30_08870 [Burkholderia arboris]